MPIRTYKVFHGRGIELRYYPEQPIHFRQINDVCLEAELEFQKARGVENATLPSEIRNMITLSANRAGLHFAYYWRGAEVESAAAQFRKAGWNESKGA